MRLDNLAKRSIIPNLPEGIAWHGWHAFRRGLATNLRAMGTPDDIMGPDGYRPALLFHASMPELRNDPRFVPLCARLGLAEFWVSTGQWPDCVDEVPYDFRSACEKARGVPIEAFGF